MNKAKEEEEKPIFTGTISVIKSPLMDKLFGATEAREELREPKLKRGRGE